MSAELRHFVAGIWKRRGRSDITRNPDPVPPAPVTTGPTASAGALPVGKASYPVPSGALFVDPNTGVDTAAGTIAAPLKTIRAAVAKVAANGTIVLRAGTYYEGSSSFDPQPAYGITLSGTKVGVTIQNYPNEAAWMDGSPPITTPWTQEGTTWSTPYVRAFDRTPANVRGKGDDPGNQGVEWTWINPAFPCAPFPDMVFYDGVQLTQVLNKTDLGPGKFWVEGTSVGGTGTNANVFNSTKLWLGSDPAGHQVRASTFCKALLAIAPDTTLRGFGVRGYADSNPDTEQPITLVRDRCVVENVVVEDCAMGGISMSGGNDCVLRRVTSQRCGRFGASIYQNDRLLIDSCRFEYNNFSRFNYAPTSAGFKMVQTKNPKFINTVFSNNYAHGLWFDMSVHTPLVLTCDMQNNYGSGLIVEISAYALVADCLITGNGIGSERAVEKVFDLNVDSSSGVRLWNNTLSNQGYNVTWNQSPRRYSGSAYPGYGRDGRYYPDPTMTWQIVQASMNNCILSGSGGSSTWLFSLNTPGPATTYPWTNYGYTGGGNLFNRKGANLPSWLFNLSGRTPTTILFDLPSLKTTTGQEAGSGFVDLTDVLNPDYTLKSAYAGAATPVPLPSDVGALINRPAGTAHLGCWR